MPLVKRFEDLQAWQEARKLTQAIYDLTRSGSEVQSCLYVALDQRYCSREKFQEMYNRTEQVRGLVVGFIRYLRNSHIQAPRHASTQALRHSGTQERTYAPN